MWQHKYFSKSAKEETKKVKSNIKNNVTSKKIGRVLIISKKEKPFENGQFTKKSKHNTVYKVAWHLIIKEIKLTCYWLLEKGSFKMFHNGLIWHMSHCHVAK